MICFCLHPFYLTTAITFLVYLLRRHFILIKTIKTVNEVSSELEATTQFIRRINIENELRRELEQRGGESDGGSVGQER